VNIIPADGSICRQGISRYDIDHTSTDNISYYNMTSRVILLYDRFFPREVAGISPALNVIISARAGIVARVVTVVQTIELIFKLI